jgi:bifunctional DNA-binding transcriptional regulator/antitoxin component of YhaV-PrlF toxin-antitoxin module
MTPSVSAEARLRAKSQLTLPEPIVDAAGVAEGDRFLVEIAPDEPDTIRLHRIRSSYAGALREVFGDTADYLAAERGSWRRGDGSTDTEPR